jgi:hypothetical protein
MPEFRMKNFINTICPVSTEKADENVVRTIAIVTALTTTIAILAGSYLILFLLGADFAVRSFSSGTGSLLKIIAGQIAGILGIRHKKYTDAAPKKFAAMMGMTFSLLAGLFLLIGLPIAAIITASILIFCALLEGIFGFCLGCFVYTILTSASGKA